MRRILFRGKRTDGGGWVRGSYIEATHRYYQGQKSIHRSWIAKSALANGGWFTLVQRFPVKDETVSQCTGLNDINGLPIFEGDIIAKHLDIDHDPERLTYGFISWNQEHAAWSYNERLPKDWKGCIPDDLEYEDVDGIETWEVVGNVWDTPELMEANR